MTQEILHHVNLSMHEPLRYVQKDWGGKIFRTIKLWKQKYPLGGGEGFAIPMRELPKGIYWGAKKMQNIKDIVIEELPKLKITPTAY